MESFRDGFSEGEHLGGLFRQDWPWHRGRPSLHRERRFRDGDADAREYSPPPTSMAGASLIVQSLSFAYDHRACTPELSICLDHLSKFLFQVGDLVTEPGGDLELQLCRRRVHLLCQVLHQIGEVPGWHTGQVTGVRTDVLDAQH